MLLVTLVYSILVGKSELMLYKLDLENDSNWKITLTRVFMAFYLAIAILEVLLLAWAIHKIS